MVITMTPTWLLTKTSSRQTEVIYELRCDLHADFATVLSAGFASSPAEPSEGWSDEGVTAVPSVHKVNARVPGGEGRSCLSNGESA